MIRGYLHLVWFQLGRPSLYVSPRGPPSNSDRGRLRLISGVVVREGFADVDADVPEAVLRFSDPIRGEISVLLCVEPQGCHFTGGGIKPGGVLSLRIWLPGDL